MNLKQNTQLFFCGDVFVLPRSQRRDYIASNGAMIDELESVRKEEAMASSKYFSWRDCGKPR